MPSVGTQTPASQMRAEPPTPLTVEFGILKFVTGGLSSLLIAKPVTHSMLEFFNPSTLQLQQFFQQLLLKLFRQYPLHTDR